MHNLNNLSPTDPINTTKDNHIVSQLLLRKFWNNNHYSEYYNKKNLIKSPKYNSTTKKYSFRQMFSMQENLNDSSELFLSNIETKMGTILFNILSKLPILSTQITSIPFSSLNLTSEHVDIFVKFYVSIFYRNIYSFNTKKVIKNDFQNPIFLAQEIKAMEIDSGRKFNVQEFKKLELEKKKLLQASSMDMEQKLNEDSLERNISESNFYVQEIKKNINNAKFIIYPDDEVIVSNVLYIKGIHEPYNFSYIFPVTKNILFYGFTPTSIIKEADILNTYTKEILDKGIEFLFYSKSLKQKHIKE